ncbi:right-handed parallel beta-helix repeat-containing protein [Lignipirellula cremea]|uniref:Pectate lyase superfamily protein n=1 Tax=Lignipirellula cremea TaxID=2528010 RepID=A0A518DZ22_9BACT|nr:right-handed parallel beta-helix repeat-containing protein [Lignipirellula cremea]QDU97051.1 Pectate lyase superfamily protein [Lignipirellula cremea]
MSDVRDFGAVGDGQADDSDAIEHAIADGDGVITFPRGEYRITRTITVDLAKVGRTSINGSGGVAKLIMNGPGPALRLLGTHSNTADPTGFRPAEWRRERMPTLDGIEIQGAHEEADGVQIEGVMQATLTGVLIRQVRTAVHVSQRARNLIISHCHFYHNTGIGVHFDNLNLHQANITGSHISYNRLGGVRIENSEIRNLQITGNDIEYNNNRTFKVPGADDVATAEIYIDVGEKGSVREGTISSNTLQATYSPNGCNIRFIGRPDEHSRTTGMWSISGNVIGSQAINVHMTSARGVTIEGNHIYSGHVRNVLLEDCGNVVFGGNCLTHNPDYTTSKQSTGIRAVDCTGLTLSGLLVQDAESPDAETPAAQTIPRQGLLELIRCRRVNLSGSQLLEGAPHGAYLEDCSDTLITGCTILDGRTNKQMQSAIRWVGSGSGNMIAASRIGSGRSGAIVAPDHVRQSDNLLD